MTRRLISSGSSFEARVGYSRAVVQDTPIGRWCFVAGTTGYDYASMTMPESTLEQTRNTLKTIGSTLKEAGLGFEHVYRTRYFPISPDVFEQAIPALAEVFGEIRPANTTVITALATPEMKIEIEVEAFKPAE